jgi:hypothetical protein
LAISTRSSVRGSYAAAAATAHTSSQATSEVNSVDRIDVLVEVGVLGSTKEPTHADNNNSRNLRLDGARCAGLRALVHSRALSPDNQKMLQKQLFDIKLTSKQLARESTKADGRAGAQKLKLKAAIEKGDMVACVAAATHVRSRMLTPPPGGGWLAGWAAGRKSIRKT